MNNSIGFRAINVLGGKTSADDNWVDCRRGSPIYYLTRDTSESRIHINDLKFRTSYDWAYLLMHKCREVGKLVEAHKQIAKNGMMEAAFYLDKKPDQPEIATPEQITIACLEVLEQKT